MNWKRALAAILWVYACWVAGGLAELLIGTPAALGLALGVGAALIVALDPIGVIWAAEGDKAVRSTTTPPIEGAKSLGDPSTL